jgi:hypothetical protein
LVEHTAENRGVAGSIPALAMLDSRSLGAEVADAGKAGIGGVAKSHLRGNISQ